VQKSQILWKSLFEVRWPLQRKSLQLKSWYFMFARRAQVKVEHFGPQPIEGCAVVFECPLFWSELKGEIVETISGTRRLCDQCNRHVYLVSKETDERVVAMVALGECVAFDRKPKERRRAFLGMMMRVN
jgi:hypothetical protein